eukprot:CAMPEP_0113645796 /NCGR_PEP_ID=MMETSP0017_2-20120614/24155_1 /TAXON_ID=2856 /ORGANISM="Cylindrotheca closterium" /LENGTH=1160 /DNA_ID=CAMNT_0000557583 /DNA_START=12 /DNA_END=3494 /DNA_ORIENTATION=- /assembly_acc=CAM_ASM_000147
MHSLIQNEPPETGFDKGDVEETSSINDIESAVPSDEDSALESAGTFRLEQQKEVSGSTYVILAVVVLATVVFSAATTLLVDTNQRKFRSEFESFARELNDIAWNNMDTMVGQLATLAVSITSENVDNGMTPNVTIANMDRRTQDIAESTGIDMIMYAPIVERSLKSGWQQYASESSQEWITQDYRYRGWNVSALEHIGGEIFSSDFESDKITNKEKTEIEATDAYIDQVLSNSGYSSGSINTPVSQFGPGLVNSSLIMMDLFSHPTLRKDMSVSLKYSEPVLSEPSDVSFLMDHILPHTNYTNGTKRSYLIYPVREDFRQDSDTMGFLIGIVSWEAFFNFNLPPTVNGIYTVVKSNCGKKFTFVRNGNKPSFFESDDTHDPRYDVDKVMYPFFERQAGNLEEVDTEFCQFDLDIYPSDDFRASFDPTDPSIYAGLIVVAFVFFGAIFFLYDRFTKNRQKKLQEQAKRAEAIVTSVFPEGVGLRLIQQAHQEATNPQSSKKMLNSFLSKNDMTGANLRRKPIADLFPNTTVMFADIVGFTAWSSTREPSQVFILLETVYKEFDTLAKQREVFKVETVGDCYVAVCGLPEPKKDHMTRMALFAADCLASMSVQVQSLEEELGPETADLGIRIGLHSGPVTAGVLRGDRARFQLFGDTVNTCARVETTGERNKIHLSKDTADLLTQVGKSHWIMPRNDKVYAKGKGEIQTFWMRNLQTEDGVSTADGKPRSDHVLPSSFSQSKRRVALNGTIERRPQDLNQRKFDRLVNWNVDVLTTLLKQVVERRETLGVEPDEPSVLQGIERELSTPVSQGGKAAFDQVVESIELATFNAKANGHHAVDLGEQVKKELKEYVRTIASMYNDNPFHNFEHASHVTMSVMKLLSRIVAPDIEGDESQLHDHTYGITSDPLTQFTVVLAALLHDVDHLGVPNSQLVKEVPELSDMYKDKSVAEQNSIDLAWALLMDDRFGNLRRSISSTTSELHRFRQLLVNTILATDIMDKELKALRNAKWDKAFSQDMMGGRGVGALTEINNRKATVVIEHLIQASDIAHTMQHWQVYRKWNQRLFKEMYRAYREGHADKDPSEGWYEGEIGFFDFYIIPLAKKLDECGVFGVSSHEYLNYAEQNRKEWEKKGRSVVADFIQEAREEHYSNRNFYFQDDTKD